MLCDITSLLKILNEKLRTFKNLSPWKINFWLITGRIDSSKTYDTYCKFIYVIGSYYIGFFHTSVATAIQLTLSVDSLLQRDIQNKEY